MMFIRDNFTSPRDRFFSLREKIANNFTFPRKKVGERHVFLRGRPSSPREEVAEKEKLVRCIIPHVVSSGQRWHVVQLKKISQRLSRTQKMMI